MRVYIYIHIMYMYISIYTHIFKFTGFQQIFSGTSRYVYVRLLQRLNEKSTLVGLRGLGCRIAGLCKGRLPLGGQKKACYGLLRDEVWFEP